MKYFTALIAVLAVGLLTLLPSDDTHAANGSDFNPGYIIDDYVFYNSGAMDTAQIQNFLNSKNPSCDYWGTQPASDWGYPNITHAQLAEYKRNGTNGFSQDSGFHAPPYRCLTMYSQSTPQVEAASGYCNAINAGDRTAAQIINDVAKACGINPQVLIILLQKEQGLVTDTWPLNRQLKHATGFACPDTAPCNPAYEGFFYQVYNAARQFKVYKAFPNSYNYSAGRTNNIYWHPDMTRCGSSSVYIQNQATAALYIYTPYRPNDAALNNLYGTGDSCSSYGNRNFWRTFTDWFGSTKVSFTPLDSPRVMQTKNETKRFDIQNGTEFGDTIPANTQAYFVDKIYVYGKWYARTEYAKNNNHLYGIPVDDIIEVPLTPISPRWVSLPSTVKKVDPFQRKQTEDISGKSATQVVDSVTVEGVLYYRTKWESTQGRRWLIPATSTENFKFYDFTIARGMVVSRDTQKVDPQTGTSAAVVPKNTTLYFNKLLNVDGKLYAQTQADNGTPYGILASDLSEATALSSLFVSLDNPRYMQIKNTTKRVDLQNGQFIGDDITYDTQAYFTDKVFAYGAWYVRTEYSRDNRLLIGIRIEDIENIPVTAITPKWISIPRNIKKIDPFKRITFETIQGGNATQVVDSVTINGTPYYRTKWEHSQNRPRYIPANGVEDFTFYNFDAPRWMSTNKDTQKVNVHTGASISSIPQNTTLFFNKRIILDGKLYAQLQSDNGTVYAILAADLREI